jgi:hypothetical protein
LFYFVLRKSLEFAGSRQVYDFRQNVKSQLLILQQPGSGDSQTVVTVVANSGDRQCDRPWWSPLLLTTVGYWPVTMYALLSAMLCF